MATATYVDSSQAAASAVAVPTGYQAGDVMVAWGVDIENPPDGSWGLIRDVAGLGIFIRIWAKYATASEGSGGNYTFLNAGATPNLTVACVRGALLPPADTDDANGVTATADMDAVDFPAQGGLLLCFFGASGATLTGTPSGMTQRENTSDLIELWTESRASGSSGTRSNSLSGAAFWLTMPVALASDPENRGSFGAAAGGGTAAASGSPTIVGALGALGGGATATLSGGPTVTGAFASSAGGGSASLGGSPTVSGSFGATAGGGQASAAGSPTIVGALGALGGGGLASLLNAAAEIVRYLHVTGRRQRGRSGRRHGPN